jgi:hypothetical protein
VPILSSISDNEISLVSQPFKYPGLTRKFSYESFVYGHDAYFKVMPSTLMKFPLLSKAGFMLDYNYFIRKHRKVNALFLHTTGEELQELKLDIKDYFVKFCAAKLSNIADFRALIEPMNNNTIQTQSLIMLQKADHDRLFDPTTRRLSTSVKKGSHKAFDKFGWLGVSFGLEKTILNERFLENNASRINLIRDYEIKTRSELYKPFNDLLERYIGNNVVIPYAIEDRKVMYPKAFEELEQYMRKYNN